MQNKRSNAFTALSFALVAALSFSTANAKDAAPAQDHQAIRHAVSLINPKADVRAINEFGMPGVKQVLADTSVIYISDDGRYVFSGLMLDMVEKRNLSDEAQSIARTDMLNSIPKGAVISYEPKEVKHRITVFTDVTCGYCQMFHRDMQSYLDKGIAVDYVPFPRGGQQSPVFTTMKNVWCSKDKKSALETAYKDMPIAAAECNDSVAAMYELGDKLGVQGTPAIYDAYGNHLGGYVSPDQMIQDLDRHAARKKRGSTATAAAK